MFQIYQYTSGLVEEKRILISSVLKGGAGCKKLKRNKKG